MIILEQQEIHSAIVAITESLKDREASEERIKSYQQVYNVFVKYLLENSIARIDENICLDYIYHKTGVKLERFECVVANSRVDYRLRPLILLVRYLDSGQVQHEMRKTKPSFICPPCFQEEYDAFCEEMDYRGYSKATMATNTQKVQSLLSYLAANEITSSEDIDILTIDGFLKTYEGNAVKYVGVILYVLRNYFSFLYTRGYTSHDLAPKFPKIRVPRNGTIPYGWSKSDIQRLLGAIDREDPKGKRDYAILLIAVRLGLRVGDIRNLKQASIDWQRNTINLTVSKTSKPTELPLLKDIGWAIIDYLQNGRPNTTSECLFVRHRAPFNAFGSLGSFSKELHRYIIKAGLEIPQGKRRGMHSLRNALAGNMLDAQIPLPVISEALVHESINTTGIYLKIDIEGLRKCAVDPEGVFAL